MKFRQLLALSISTVSTMAAAAPVTFQDQSTAAGLTGYTESWGLVWTDINSDGWPDLFLQGHRDFPRVYRNTGAGTFEDVANEYDPHQLWMDKTWEDKHGTTSADVDNDGDQDIMISVSGSGDAELLINELETGGYFTDHAPGSGLSYDSTARMAVWFDYNDDGQLDVQQHTSGGSFLRYRHASRFTWPLDRTNYCGGHGDYGQLTDVNNDGHLDYVCGRQGTFPQHIYDYSGGAFTSTDKLEHLVPDVDNVIDTIAGDFNNDLKSDFILMRGAIRASGAAKIDNFGIDGWLRGSSEVGFEFTASGDVEFIVESDPMGIYSVPAEAVYTASGQVNETLGLVKISYSDATGKWTVKRGNTAQAYVKVRAANPVSEPVMINMKGNEAPLAVRHLVNSNSGYSLDYSTGIGAAKSCVSGVAADFDNDMDLDIYLACRQGVNNLANRYFDNQGDGTFVEVANFGGEGPVGAGTEFGVADSVAIADYNVDGFMDIAVTNGLLFYPVGLGGPDTLIKNNGNGNSWVELDLTGVTSNRDGVGAKIYATAGGVTQVREQNNGYHRWSQNSQVVHFGLANNQSVDITIEWPSGEVDTFSGVSANTLYEAVEGATALAPINLGPEVHTVVESGDECGEPGYEKTYGPGITMWKECSSTGDWRVRFNSGLEEEHPIFNTGTVLGDDSFSYASGVSVNSGDTFNLAGSLLSFDIGVQNKIVAKKGFNLNTGAQTTSCMEFSNQEMHRVIVGGSQKRITAPFDLVTLDSCMVDPPTNNDACFEPDYDNATEKGVFVWKACDGTDEWNMRVTGGGDAGGTVYEGVITSDGGVPYSGYSIEASDVLDTSVANELNYVLKVWNKAQDGINFTPADNACLTSTSAGIPVYIGESRLEISNSVNLTTLEACDTVVVDDTAACGEPSYDNKTEPGFYVWKDCSTTGSNESWSMRAVAGGASWGPYSGSLTSSTALTPAGVSLEGSDILTSGTNVDFTLYVGGGGVDGADVAIPASSETCLNVSTLPAGSSVFVGFGKQAMTGEFNLNDLGACP